MWCICFFMKIKEHDEQVLLVKWLEAKGIRFFAVPNGGERNIIVATRLKAEGVRSGAPDLIVFMPKVTVGLELKTKNGKVSENQKDWLSFLYDRPGWTSFCAFGVDEAIEFLERLI
jgi:hypothetical protein